MYNYGILWQTSKTIFSIDKQKHGWNIIFNKLERVNFFLWFPLLISELCLTQSRGIGFFEQL